MSEQLSIYRSSEYGGSGGGPFNAFDGVDFDAENATLRSVHVFHGVCVGSIWCSWLIGGLEIGGATHGRCGGREDFLRLDVGERIITIGVRADWYVRSLQFTTNKKEYPWWGGDAGVKYKYDVVGELVGFEGKAGSFIDQIVFVSKV